MKLAPALLENTYTVEFYHEPNNLTITADVVSTDSDAAEAFARRRFILDQRWTLVGIDKKYKENHGSEESVRREEGSPV
jgi:hypothetical protein